MFNDSRCPVCSKDYHSNKRKLLESLGLDPNLDPSEKEINQAFREKSKVVHPDKPTGSTSLFEELLDTKEELLEMIGAKKPLEEPTIAHQERIEVAEESNEPFKFTFKEKQRLKKSLRNLRLGLKRGSPCPFCKQRY